MPNSKNQNENIKTRLDDNHRLLQYLKGH